MGHQHRHLVLGHRLLQPLLLLEPRHGRLTLRNYLCLILRADMLVLFLHALRLTDEALAGGRKALRRRPARGHLVVAFLHRVANLLQLRKLLEVHLARHVLPLIVQPVLHFVQLRAEAWLGVLRDKVRQWAVELVAHVVHVTLQRVLRLVGGLDMSVLVLQLLLHGKQRGDSVRPEARQGRHKGDVLLGHLDRLLGLRGRCGCCSLVCRGGGCISLHRSLAVLRGFAVFGRLCRLTFLCHHRLHLYLRLLHCLHALHGQNAVQVDVHLNLQLGLVAAIGRQRDGRADGEVTDVSQRPGWQVCGLVVLVIRTERKLV
mmetsp:Transcript_29414/g.52599  ORF Transcript_29414/g.52599 Transcript_29414/m.52599 type:complete len:316 (-) Transcript_29414:205-1152(-)